MKNEIENVIEYTKFECSDRTLIADQVTTLDENGKEKIIPAILSGQIGTPDNKLFIVNSPTENYTNYLSIAPIQNDDLSYRYFVSRMFKIRMQCCIKEIIITAFNLLNNPVGDGDDALINVNGISIYDNPQVLYTREPSRQPIELFTKRETLDYIFDNFYYIDSNPMNYNTITERSMFEYGIFIISNIYDMCLRFIDCEKDVVNFNRFIGNLSKTIPTAMNNLYYEWKNIYEPQCKKPESDVTDIDYYE